MRTQEGIRLERALVERCRPLLESLNAQYGKGNVGAIRLFLDGTGDFIQTPFQCRPRKLTFRLLSGEPLRIRAIGHQITEKRGAK